jgi:hypothetical protein
MSNTSNYMSPEEINMYQVRRQQADTAFGRGRANLDYQRGIATQDYGLGKPRLARSWDKAFKQLPGSFARRGLLRSGVYNQGFGDYRTDRENAENDWDLQNNRRMAGFQNQQDDFESVRTMQLQSIEAERLARQAALSSNIQARQ